MTYYCNRCGTFIEDTNLAPTGDFFKGIEHGACPKCYNEDLEEAWKCDVCGEAVKPYEQFCDECKTEFMNAWSKAVSYASEFTKKDMVTAERLLLDFMEREVF